MIKCICTKVLTLIAFLIGIHCYAAERSTSTEEPLGSEAYLHNQRLSSRDEQWMVLARTTAASWGISLDQYISEARAFL